MRGLAATSLFVALESGRPVRVDDIPEQLAVLIVTVGELRAGVLSAVAPESRARRLETLIRVTTISPESRPSRSDAFRRGFRYRLKSCCH